MTLLSKDTSGVILPIYTYRTHLDASKKTIDIQLEIKAAGEILAEIWSESIIDGHSVKTTYIDPQECSINTTESERWKRVHVQQSWYMLQIAKCNDQCCCKFHTNYLTYFSERFLPPSMPLKATVDGLEIFEEKFRSLFQSIFLAEYADKCFDKFFPSWKTVRKKGKSTMKLFACRLICILC